MRGLQVHELIGPDGLRFHQNLPEPEAGDGVLVGVEFAGVSFPDLLTSQGLYQRRSEPPYVPGFEVSGRVLMAPADSGLAVGQRVYGGVGGAFAEVAVGRPGLVFPLPEELSLEEGAALLVNYQTALFALSERAALQAGESVLVLGAAGGVGTAALQVARGLGAARIVAVVSTDQKASVALAAGATDAVLLGETWRQEVLELTGGGVDLVYDPVGGDTFLDATRCMKPGGGRLVIIGFAAGSIPEIRVNRLLLRNVSLVGAAWGEAFARDPELPARLAGPLRRLVADGSVKPPIGRVFPLAEGADALRHIAAREATGKVLLRLR